MFVHKMEDSRINCISILTSMPTIEYLTIIDGVYKDKGGIDGQRSALKTKTAITIRNRMVDDIKSGAILPPIVIGVMAKGNEMDTIRSINNPNELIKYVSELEIGRVSIIDGMQRTTAIIDANRESSLGVGHETRVEFWVANNVNSLIYRMLVLNTGQVPWDIGRQLETVYWQLILQIKESLGENVTIFLADSKKRRSQPGQYQSKNIVELFLLFSSRKSEVEIKDKISEDFVRLDAIETTSNNEILEFFIKTVALMSKLDREFARLLTDQGAAQPESERINNGKDVFKSFPAMAGFCAACAIAVLDEPGFPIDIRSAHIKMEDIEKSINGLCAKISDYTQDQLNNFMQLELLNEKLKQRSSQVGRFEREFFRKAFASMIRNSDRLETLEPCWMAH
jgi:predicted ribosome-associated RNA-binding protein Tma20